MDSHILVRFVVYLQILRTKNNESCRRDCVPLEVFHCWFKEKHFGLSQCVVETLLTILIAINHWISQLIKPTSIQFHNSHLKFKIDTLIRWPKPIQQKIEIKHTFAYTSFWFIYKFTFCFFIEFVILFLNFWELCSKSSLGSIQREIRIIY